MQYLYDQAFHQALHLSILGSVYLRSNLPRSMLSAYQEISLMVHIKLTDYNMQSNCLCGLLSVSPNTQDMIASWGMFLHTKAGMVLQHEYIQPEKAATSSLHWTIWQQRQSMSTDWHGLWDHAALGLGFCVDFDWQCSCIFESLLSALFHTCSYPTLVSCSFLLWAQQIGKSIHGVYQQQCTCIATSSFCKDDIHWKRLTLHDTDELKEWVPQSTYSRPG